MNSYESDMKKYIQEFEDKRQKDIADLESRSKQLSELVTTEEFTVERVVAETYSTSFTPSSEIVYGGSSPVYRGGFTSRLVLEVSPKDENVPVRTLIFNGF